MVRGYVTTWVVGAVALTAFLLLRSGPLPVVEFVFFLALLAFAEAKPVRLAGLGGRVLGTVTFMLAMVAILKMPPGAVALASGLAVFGSFLERDRSPAYKIIFNAAQSAVAGGLAAQTYRFLGGSSTIDTERLMVLVFATGASTAIYFFINSIAVSGAISISSRAPFVQTWYRTHGWLAATYVAFGASGLVLAALYQSVGMVAVPLLLVPLLVARQVFRAYDEVRGAYEETVKAFVSAIEAKDAYTRGHSERVAAYSMLIAGRMGIRDEALDVFHYGALLHDVGKLIIRKNVLTKRAKLDEHEFAEIKRHPVVGAQIVREIEFLRPSLDAVLYHHERLDGSGYPAGLSGEMIPLWARIMAVGDTYDAMTSTRAYRGARSHDEAVAELRRCSGGQLDPACVEVFVAALEEGLRWTDEELVPLDDERRKEAYETQVASPAAG